MKCVNVQFFSPGLKVDVAERLESAYSQLGEFYEKTAAASKFFQVALALAIKIRAHLFNLKICHIIQAACDGAFVIFLAEELKPLDKSATRKHLVGSVYQFGKAEIFNKNAHNVAAAGRPDSSFVASSLQASLGINVEQLRMQRPLIKRERQLADRNICFGKIHSKTT